MTVKYSKFKSICKNCGASGENYRYIRMSNMTFIICPSCADIFTCIAQISSNFLSPAAFSMLGTDEGIQKGLNTLKTEAIKQGFKLDNEEAQNAKE